MFDSKFNNKIPIVSARKELPIARRKGIITLTLVISRSSERLPVTRKSFVMFLFKVKTKLQYQLEEYIEWKSRFSTRSASEHKEVILNFIEKFKFKDTKEITIDIIKEFRSELTRSTTHFSTMKAMQALRCFLRYYKKQVDFNPEAIQDEQIIDLPIVEESAIVVPMKEKLLGRPPKVALIKAVKELRNVKKMSFRAIAKELKKDVSQVHVWYKYDIPSEWLRE